ncbi:N-acetylglucosamine-6-phosphate deacetylase [Paenibacillus eucommiae]|uniref:N-acetylglucosamine-6-phosphate deacetylase n=1 Tax=Paenibacillus eucommiae TaxID=1355755 RepID=A0ABS4IUT4_9BACL|nr:amidohydrolase family protein [Paenibacillus eucommiae]MBP1990850.1 N-acetylglucosamine-6-phosphate deacetylase [Paenibacillus eucommiae]
MKWIGKRYDTGACVEITVLDGIIRSIEPVQEQPGVPWISPGWIDLQVNGFSGFDVNGEQTTLEDVIGLSKSMFSCGVTSYCPTIVTGSFERTKQALEMIHRGCEQDADVRKAICGIHVEGPYLSSEDGPRGAHDRAFIRNPDIAEFEAWQQAAGGDITLVTIAPEREGAIAFIRWLVEQGIKVSLGHTMASTEQLQEAVAAGASLSTHLGNGSHPLLPRHPNYIWDQLADDDLQAMFIADGHHVPPNVLKSMFRAKRDQFILVSDCVKFGGMAPGRYKSAIGNEVELLANGRLHTVANPAILSGSAQSLERSVANAVVQVGISLKEAVDAVTVRPTKAMGLDQLGKLELGAAGNLTLFEFDESKELTISETVLSGRSVYAAKETWV